MSSPEGARCYVFSIMKSGTYLVRSLLECVGMTCIRKFNFEAAGAQVPEPSQVDAFILAHRLPSNRWRSMCQAGEAQIIMSIRDPRAVFLSLIDFYDWRVPLPNPEWRIIEFRRQSYQRAYATRELLAYALLEHELLDDDPYTPWLNFRRSRTLLHSPSVLKIRYEDFFAPLGLHRSEDGGIISRVCRYLERPVPSNPAEKLERTLKSFSPTRNAGLPLRWRNELSPILLEAFMDKHGDLVRDFGYPEN